MYLEVSTGSRLHFGLMELCADQPRRFAGLGLMVTNPRMRVHVVGKPSRKPPRIQLPSEPASKICQVVERRRQLSLDSVFPEEILLDEQLPLHHGLGSGTQLACAVALALEVFDQQHRQRIWDSGNWIPATAALLERSKLNGAPMSRLLAQRWLVQFSGRGLRSAVGLAGFLDGGLILDHGYAQDCMQFSRPFRGEGTGLRSLNSAPGSSLVGHVQEMNLAAGAVALRSFLLENAAVSRAEPSGVTSANRSVCVESKCLASEWRVVMICPQASSRVYGAAESKLLGALSCQPNSHCRQMFQLARSILGGCDQPTRFDEFAEMLTAYLALAGGMFLEHQGGLYNGPEITAVVHCAQASGLKAVGQSSWGPTVFGFCENELEAERISRLISESCPVPVSNLYISRAMPHGALFRVR